MEKKRDAGLRAKEVVEPKGGCLDITDIIKILPHRYPFLLVDKVIEFEPDKRVVGIKNVTANENFFAGHFPGNPIMPGVLILEVMAQAGGILMFNKKENLNRTAYFVGLNNVKFRKPVVPGDILRVEVSVTNVRSRIAQLHGESKVGSEVVAEADMLFGFSNHSATQN